MYEILYGSYSSAVVMVSIGYTIEKCGLCAHVTHEFAVIPRGSRWINANEWVTAGA